MIKSDPIIAVNDVKVSSRWYQALLDCKDMHGGDKFAILTDNDNEVLLCLHKWKEDEHPTMLDPSITSGNGLILYFRTNNLEKIRQNAKEMEAEIEEDIHLNPNSSKEEFSLRDPDGYYLTISQYHEYDG
jgi:Glyoxalase/Bleomycin resistance protein/Dioxygenase superfamily